MTATLDRTRHIKYWTRCISTALPAAYTSNDSNRMYLGFFILTALDLLDSLTTACSSSDLEDYKNWIYHCQHPNGGFRMWPGTDFGERANAENAKWDPANVPATYFALASLLVLQDDLKRVKRRETLEWLRNMQRSDGSFGETLVQGQIEGGNDPRFGYCAAGVRYILRGGQAEGSLKLNNDIEVPDVDIDALVRCIRAAESFDGGIADAPFHEPHAGYTFCSLGALALVNRLNTDTTSYNPNPTTGPADPAQVLHWLVSRQTSYITETTADDTDVDADSVSARSTASSIPSATPGSPLPQATRPPESQAYPILKPTPSGEGQSLHVPPESFTTAQAQDGIHSPPATERKPKPKPQIPIGLCGRPNKVADTCYAWWVLASVSLLTEPASSPLRAGASGPTAENGINGTFSPPSPTYPKHNHPLVQSAAIKQYLLATTQHGILGGFGKTSGDLPDLYHSYLGLATLGLLSGELEADGDGLQREDAQLMGALQEDLASTAADNGAVGGRRDVEQPVDEVQSVDARLCISRRAAGRLAGVWEAWNAEAEAKAEPCTE